LEVLTGQWPQMGECVETDTSDLVVYTTICQGACVSFAQPENNPGKQFTTFLKRISQLLISNKKKAFRGFASQLREIALLNVSLILGCSVYATQCSR
jgi:hypothetical protein